MEVFFLSWFSVQRIDEPCPNSAVVEVDGILVPFLKNKVVFFYKTTLRLRPDSHAERVAAYRHESKHCQGVAQCDYILKIQYLILETALVLVCDHINTTACRFPVRSSLLTDDCSLITLFSILFPLYSAPIIHPMGEHPLHLTISSRILVPAGSQICPFHRNLHRR